MPGTRSEDFLATVRTTAARPGQVIDVVVLTSDKALLEVLRNAAGSEHALWEAYSADTAVDYLVSGRCDVLIADLGSLRGDVGALLERLQAQFPELILMATGRREQEGAVAGPLSSGRIYRFLHKPISPPRASQFLNAATRRYNELQDAEPIALTTVRTIARRRPYLGTAIAIGAGVLAAIVAFALWRANDSRMPATLQPTPVSTSSVEDTVQSKLGSAQIAYLSGRLIDPRGDNALEYYKDVLALGPRNAEAQAGIRKVIDALENRVDAALKERNAARVVTAWTALQRAAPDHPSLEPLRSRLLALSRAAPKTSRALKAERTRSRPSATTATVRTPNPGNADPKVAASNLTSAPVPNPDRPADVSERELSEAIARELIEQETAAATPAVSVAAARSTSPLAEQIGAAVRLRQRGSLIAPAGSNAFDVLMTLRERHPDAEEVRSEQQRLAFVLIDRSRTALAANNVEEAAMLIERANTLVPGMPAIRPLQEQLAAVQQQREFNTNVLQAATLKRTREVSPVYPKDAERAGTEGWVQVEFTITPEGTTSDLVVRNADPVTVFDTAALDSIGKWRFEPIRKNGAPVAQRAVLQVRFALR